MQGKRIVSLGRPGTDRRGWYRGAPWTRPHARMRSGRRRCRSRPRSPSSSPGPSSPAAPRAPTRRRRSEPPRCSSRRLSSSAGRVGRIALPRLDRAGLVAAARRGRPRRLDGPHASGGRSPATAPGTRSRRASSLLAFGVVGLAAGLLPGRPLRSLALLLAVALGAVLVWALLGKAVPALGPDDAGQRRAPEGIDRLLERARPPRGRGARARPLARSSRSASASAGPPARLLLYAATIVILLTQSRAGVIAGGRRRRTGALRCRTRGVEAALLGLLATGPAVVVVGVGLHAAGARRGRRRPRGSCLGRAAARRAYRGRRGRRARARCPRSRRAARRDPARGTSCAASSAPLRSSSSSARSASLLASGTRSRGRPTSSAARARSSNDPGRLGSLETNNRTVWWGEAWQVFRAHPAGGTGARTFEIARKRYRDDAANVTEPHSLPLQLLSDTGLPALPARARARRRARPRASGDGAAARAR